MLSSRHRSPSWRVAPFCGGCASFCGVKRADRIRLRPDLGLRPDLEVIDDVDCFTCPSRPRLHPALGGYRCRARELPHCGSGALQRGCRHRRCLGLGGSRRATQAPADNRARSDGAGRCQPRFRVLGAAHDPWGFTSQPRVVATPAPRGVWRMATRSRRVPPASRETEQSSSRAGSPLPLVQSSARRDAPLRCWSCLEAERLRLGGVGGMTVGERQSLEVVPAT
jgi:hypothetical protein